MTTPNTDPKKGPTNDPSIPADKTPANPNAPEGGKIDPTKIKDKNPPDRS
jgi:hypothetical protein